MDLTASYRDTVPVAVQKRYELRETRMAAKILAGTNPVEFAELIQVLEGFTLTTKDLVNPGGNESKLAARLNESFRAKGWREARVDTNITLALRVMPFAPAGESTAKLAETTVSNEGYKVDNFKGRVAIDVEWNAKDGNLDRDVGAYRALYDAGLIDGAVIISRTQADLRPLAVRLARAAGATEADARKRLGTTTTTNMDKLMPRVTRGDLGGCPFLGVFISAATWEGPHAGASVPPTTVEAMGGSDDGTSA